MRFVRQPGENTPRGHTRDALKRMILARGCQVGDKLPTYRQLAEHFGVALFTIERVMKELAREGVIQLLHGKGAFIRQLPACDGQLRQVGLIYTSSRSHLIRTGYLNEILAGIVQACDKRQIDLQILSFWRTGQHVPVPPHETAVRIDGAILLEILNDDYIARFAAEEIPLVLVDGQTAVPGVHAITADNVQAVDQVMDHLYTLGHRSIAYVDARTYDVLTPTAPWVDSPDTRERRQAYLAAMGRLGLTQQARVYQAVSLRLDELVQQTMQQLMHDPKMPTALLVYDTGFAAGLYHGLCQAGLRVPQDIAIAAVAGAHNEPAVGDHVLTYARIAFEQMGRLAMESLVSQAAAGRTSPDMLVRRVPADLSVGTTTAPPRAL